MGFLTSGGEKSYKETRACALVSLSDFFTSLGLQYLAFHPSLYCLTKG